MTVKVLVVDDSAFMRKIISDILSHDPEIEIIGTARNGRDALDKIKKLGPDLVTLDIEMPIMNGIECLTEVMIGDMLPVIMLSSLTIEGAKDTIRALELGAIDFLTKPTSIFDMDNEDKKRELIQKVKAAARVKLNNNTRYTRQDHQNPVGTISNTINQDYSIIAIGTSTGGPRALQEIIPVFSKNINGSIFVVQHMPPGFTKSLANRLNTLSDIHVKEAEDGEKVEKGCCYIAPGGLHMTVKEIAPKKLVIKLNNHPPISGHRPSVDVLMDSVAIIKSIKKLGVILTGMGSDGAEGIKQIKDSGGITYAQDEETCVVYGMPKSAVNNNAIYQVLPLNRIAGEIINKVGC